MDFTKLEKYMGKLSDYGIPACDIIIYKDHELVYRTMAGYSDIKKTKHVSDEDLYHLYSNTKLFTVVSGMQLIEQGKLKFDDPVSKYLPDFKNLTYSTRKGIMPVDEPMQIYHLFTMTSGITYDPSPSIDKIIKSSKGLADTKEIVSALAKEPLAFQPGKRFCYGRSHDVLGAVVEVVSNMKLSEYFRKNIAEPLGMKYITFNYDDNYAKEHLSELYEYDSVEQKANPWSDKEKPSHRFTLNYESGGAGLICSTDDYALLLDALANGGVGKNRKRILNEDSITQMKEPRLNYLQQSQFIISHCKKGYGYGLGVRTMIDKGYGARTPIGEFGWDGMTGGYGLVDTENHIAICYMQNVSGCNYAWYNVFPETRDMIYDILGIEDSEE